VAKSVWDEERFGRPLAPVTLPRFNLTDLDVEAEALEAAARVAERRIIRTGLDAWREINKAESFDGWKAIGAALAVGKAHALRVTGANAAWGWNYSREFSDWIKRRGAQRCLSGNDAGLFIRSQTSDAGALPRPTTANALLISDAMLLPRGGGLFHA
jgi:hypothetical protein